MDGVGDLGGGVLEGGDEGGCSIEGGGSEEAKGLGSGEADFGRAVFEEQREGGVVLGDDAEGERGVGAHVGAAIGEERGEGFGAE